MRQILPLLFGARCVACGGDGRGLCDRCAARLRPPPSLAPPVGMASAAAWCSYEGVGRSLIRALKYDARTSLAPLLGSVLAELFATRRWHDAVLTWAPTTPAQRRARGFDQAELLARATARLLHVPVRPLLRRVPGPCQTGRHLADRLVGPRFEPTGRLPGETAVVIDDVRTTGATLAAAAGVLHSVGVREVHALVVATTPARYHTR